MAESNNFIHNIIEKDNETGKYGGKYIRDFRRSQMDTFI